MQWKHRDTMKTIDLQQDSGLIVREGVFYLEEYRLILLKSLGHVAERVNAWNEQTKSFELNGPRDQETGASQIVARQARGGGAG